MADLTVQTLTDGALAAITFVAAAASQTLPYTGKEFLLVKNGDASPHDLTIDSVIACNQGSDHDKTLTVAAGAQGMLKPKPPVDRWQDVNGKIALTWSATTSMTVAAVKWPE